MTELNLNVTLDQMLVLFDKNVIGVRELRNWLANHSASFDEIRDSDVDKEIELRAQYNRETLDKLLARSE